MLRLVLLRLVESYFRHRWLYLLPIAVMTASAIVYVSSMSPTYVVSGTLYVQNGNLLSSLTDIRPDGYSYITPAQATMGELYQLLNAKAFLRAIIQKTDMEVKMGADAESVATTITEARDAIWLQELGSNLVMIAAQHEMPRTAQQLAEATIETYIQWKINLNREESVAAQNFFTDLIKTYQSEVEPARQALDNYLKTHPKPLQGDRLDEEAAEIKRLQNALDSVEERLRRAENQEESARLALIQAESTVRQSYFVVDAPTRPLAPERSKKDMLITLAIFIMAGFGISVVGIVGGALLDDSLRFPIDVVHGLNLPVLTIIADSPISLTRTAAIPKTGTTPTAESISQSTSQSTSQSMPSKQGQLHSWRMSDSGIDNPVTAKQAVADQPSMDQEPLMVKDVQKRKSLFG